MTTIEIATQVLQRNIDLFNMFVSDLSDADMLARPCAGANHATWQIGHMILAETGMISSIKPDAMPAIPAGWDKKFNKETAGSDDASFFPKKKELVDHLNKVRTAAIAWANTLTPADLDKPTPERIQRFAPTIGVLLMMMPLHLTMHIGQIQVIRRKLGRPIMF